MHWNKLELTQNLLIQKGIDKTAYVSIFGALVENIIYGIAIGAGYHRSVGCGVAIGISLLAECIPHKITDFKLLTGVGLSKKVFLYEKLRF